MADRNVADNPSNPDKVTPVGADRVMMIDSETAPNSLKEITFTNLAAWWASLTATLTNKTLSLASNTLAATLAQLNAAISDADVASLTGTETLTNKTLTTPTIASMVNANHNHADAAGGGLLYQTLSNWTPTWTNLTLGAGTLSAKYLQIGKFVSFHLTLQFAADTVISGAVFFTPPVAALTTALNAGIGIARYRDASLGFAHQGVAQLQITGVIACLVYDASATYLSGQNLSSTIPYTWAVNDEFIITGNYLAA